MIVKKDKLKLFLEVKKLSNADFAEILDVDEGEIEKLVNGGDVGYDTARKFINFFKGEIAQHYIDWETMNIKNPLEDKE